MGGIAIICGGIILLDYADIVQTDGIAYFMCWVGAIFSSIDAR